MKRKHHDLLVWQEAIKLVKVTYDVTKSFPRDEQFALTAQMRRAAVSVPSNIAEGAARSSAKEFVHFLTVARGSLSELETQFVIARELGYLEDLASVDTSLDRAFRLLSGLITSSRKTTQA